MLLAKSRPALRMVQYEIGWFFKINFKLFSKLHIYPGFSKYKHMYINLISTQYNNLYIATSSDIMNVGGKMARCTIFFLDMYAIQLYYEIMGTCLSRFRLNSN